MMVDNKVAGDSRVLKSAQTVADLGYRVLVLGRRGPSAEELDEASFRVKLVRVRRRMPPAEEQIFVGRHPLAYPTSWPPRLRTRPQAGSAGTGSVRIAGSGPSTPPSNGLRR